MMSATLICACVCRQVYVWPLVHISQMWTVWITVLVAFNRYVAICRPFQAIRICTMRQSRLQVLVSAVSIIVYNIPRFLEHRLDYYSEVGLLAIHRQHLDTLAMGIFKGVGGTCACPAPCRSYTSHKKYRPKYKLHKLRDGP